MGFGRAPPRMMKRRRGRMASDEGDLNRRRQRHCQLPSVCTPAAGKSPVAILSLMCECVRGDRGEREREGGRKRARHRHAASTTPPRWNRDDDTDADGTAVPLSEAVSCLPTPTAPAHPARRRPVRPGRHSREVIYLAPYLRDRDLTKKREGTGGRLISA